MGRAIVMLVRAMWSLWNLFKERKDQARCPGCGEFWAAEEMGEERMGIFKKPEPRLVTRYSGEMVPYEKYKVHCKCKYCNRTWEFSRSRKL
jgi:hypothetical protein